MKSSPCIAWGCMEVHGGHGAGSEYGAGSGGAGDNEVCTGVHGVHEAAHEEMKCAQGCTGVHGSAWVSATWVMHDARGAYGGPTINGAQM